MGPITILDADSGISDSHYVHWNSCFDRINSGKQGVMVKQPKSLIRERPGKFRNVMRGYFSIGGKKIFFRSKWEANYALYLNLLKKNGDIKKWEYEADVFIFHEIKFGTRSYKPDFKITKRDGSIYYDEVKGWMTQKSKTQLKRMAKYYPNIKLNIVGRKEYTEIKNKLGKVLRFF